jgi:hypothetical protein
MEHTSTYQNIQVTPSEVQDLIPKEVWNKIEKQILENANEKYGWNLTGIDFCDINDDGTFWFGVYN